MIFMNDLKTIEKAKQDILNLVTKNKKVSMQDIRNQVAIQSSFKENSIRVRALDLLIKENKIYKNASYYLIVEETKQEGLGL